MDLNERKRKILEAIIEDYISSAEPVGSRTISKHSDMGLSSATIRNEMSDLEEMGYLISPHTSAGRIPTDAGYRFYVNELMEQYKVAQKDIVTLRRFLRRVCYSLISLSGRRAASCHSSQIIQQLL